MKPTTYHVTLINLSADAQSVVEDTKLDRRGVADDEMRRLLETFCTIDPVANATTEPEVRVLVRAESYLIRTGQNKLLLYDARNHEAPGEILTVDQVMAELDGSALAAWAASIPEQTVTPEEASSPILSSPTAPTDNDSFPVPVLRPPDPPQSVPRLIALLALVIGLAGTIFYLRFAGLDNATPAGFNRVAATEAAELQESFAGTYLTGPQPGQHGIALTAGGEVRIFELRAVEAPRVIHATGTWGRIGPALAVATDQPGGLITAPNPETLVYCGETYRRIH